MIKGVHIDCRGQKLRPEALLAQLRDLADWGYNTVLLEYMDAFPFEGRLSCLSAPDAYTREEVARINGEAEALGIEIIPLVQTFGHLYWVLRHREFMPLAEGWSPDPATGEMREEDIHWPSGVMRLETVCPSNPGSLELVRELVTQIRALHPKSRYMHIGGDEIRRPSCPRCQAYMQEHSMPELLAKHYAACAELVRDMGATPIVWCDILLAYPETLDILKGRMAVMDWDYWSDGKPTPNGRLWGLTEQIHEPDKWPKLQQELFRPYLYAHEPDLIKAFPFTELLRDKGFEVLVASAARCGGDAFCIPMERHLRNVPASAEKAAAAGVTGFVVTSWAIRRSPLPMTDLSLMLGAAHADGKCSQEEDGEVRRAFALRHFGVSSDRLGELPALLGKAVTGCGCDLLQSYNEYSDYETGNLFAPEYDQEYFSPRTREMRIAEDSERFLADFASLREVCAEARERLKEASPTGRFVKLWYWALEVLELYCDAAPFLAVKTLETEEERRGALAVIQRAEAMKQPTAALLGKLYTDFTIVGELQCRYTVLIHALKRRLGIPYTRLD